MRIPLTIGERDPAQVQTTLDNWYTVQMRRRTRLKRGYLRNRGRDVRRTQGNNGQHRRTMELGLAHMYQYKDTGKIYGDIPLPIDEHDTLRHV
jgi:hypothetical protein